MKITLRNAKSLFTDLKECVNFNKHNKLTLFVSVGLSDNETTAPGRSFRNLKCFQIVVNEMNSLMKCWKKRKRKEQSNKLMGIEREATTTTFHNNFHLKYGQQEN